MAKKKVAKKVAKSKPPASDNHRQRKSSDLPDDDEVSRGSTSFTLPDRLVTNAGLMAAMGVKRTTFYEVATPSMIEVVHETGRYKYYWLQESLERYMTFLRQTINSLQKSNTQLSKNSNAAPSDKRLTQLELESAEIKVRKDNLTLQLLEKKQAPFEVFEKALEKHTSNVRSILITTGTDLRSMYEDDVPQEMFTAIQSRLNSAINQMADLSFEDDDFDDFMEQDEAQSSENDNGEEAEEEYDD